MIRHLAATLRLLTILIVISNVFMPSSLRAQDSNASSETLTIIPLDQADQYRISEVVLKTLQEGRVLNTPPEAARRSDVIQAMRVKKGSLPFKGDIETDARNLIDEYHYFASVTPKLEKTGETSARLVLVCQDPPVAALSFLELIAGRWQINPEGSFEGRTGLGFAVGDSFSIDRMDRELRERLFDSERFIDIKTEHRYDSDGVHVTVKMVREQMVDLVVLSGVYAESVDSVIKESRELARYLGPEGGADIDPDDTRRKLGSKGNLLFTSKFAGRHTIELIKRGIRRLYVQKGYPDADLTYHVVDVPSNFLGTTPEDYWPELSQDQVEAVMERGLPGQTVLILSVHEGPHTEIANIHFDGIESLVNAPALEALEPGTLPSSYWPIWYAMPWAERVDRIKRALFSVMQNGPGAFSPQPDFNLEATTQDAAFIERHLRAAGWQDVNVTLKAIRYNGDRTRVEITYDLNLGPLYVLTHVGLAVDSKPPLSNPDGPPEALVASLDEIWEAMQLDGNAVDMPFDLGGTMADRVWEMEQAGAYNVYQMTGNPFDPTERGAQRRIEALFGKFGYSRIEFEATPIYQNLDTPIDNLHEDLKNHSVVAVRLAVKINQGHRYRIGEINVTGNAETKTSVILRQLALTAGELFDIDEMRRGESRLRRLQWFDQQTPGAGVSVTPNYSNTVSPADEDCYTVNVSVNVVEGNTGSINFSAGFSPGSSAVVSISLTKRNLDLLDWGGFTGAGQYLELALEPQIAERQRYSLTFREPFLFGYPLEGSLSLSILEQDRGPFTVGEKGGRIAVGYRLERDFSLVLSYQNFENEISDPSESAPFEIKREEGTTRFAALGLEGTYSTLNQLFFPTDGWRASLEGLLAADALGGNVDMWRVTGSARRAITLYEITPDREVALNLSWVGIWQDTYGSTERVPLAQRLFLGSIEPGRPTLSLRGYERSGVGPRAGDDAIGGNFLLNATAEVTVPLQPGFFWVLGFVDAGELVPKIENFDPEGVTVSAGFGFRIVVPLFPAPFGVDFGWPIYDQPGNETQVISVNFAFGF